MLHAKELGMNTRRGYPWRVTFRPTPQQNSVTVCAQTASENSIPTTSDEQTDRRDLRGRHAASRQPRACTNPDLIVENSVYTHCRRIALFLVLKGCVLCKPTWRFRRVRANSVHIWTSLRAIFALQRGHHGSHIRGLATTPHSGQNSQRPCLQKPG